jgi:type III secretion protein T
MTDFDEMVALAEALESVLLTVALSSIRLFAAFNVLPATGPQFLQGLTRSGVVVMIGSYVAFGMPAEAVHDITAAQWLGLAVKETIIGLLIGFAAATVFWTAECVGAMIDTQTGYNNVQLSNPLSGQQSTPVSNLLLQLVIMVFYTLGGMMVFIGALFESFTAWPILAPLPSMQGVSDVFFLREIDTLMTAVVKFAAPILLVLVLIDLGFGLITRGADKLEPSSLSQPVKGAVTMLLLALLVGIFIEQVRHHLLPNDVIERIRSLVPAQR